jgi:hypothetical protein
LFFTGVVTQGKLNKTVLKEVILWAAPNQSDMSATALHPAKWRTQSMDELRT